MISNTEISEVNKVQIDFKVHAYSPRLDSPQFVTSLSDRVMAATVGG